VYIKRFYKVKIHFNELKIPDYKIGLFLVKYSYLFVYCKQILIFLIYLFLKQFKIRFTAFNITLIKEMVLEVHLIKILKIRCFNV
jgi:hypothetical protein